MKIKTIKHAGVVVIWKCCPAAAGNAMSFRASDKLQLSDRIGENA